MNIPRWFINTLWIVADTVLFAFAIVGIVHVIKNWASIKRDAKSTARSVSGRVASAFKHEGKGLLHTEKDVQVH